MTQIFVSYSRVDTEFTKRLVDRLRRVYGLSNVWYDDELHGGANWWQEILNQIAKCDVFIYMLSNESVTSSYCQAEFAEARRLQKPIITIQVRDRTRLSVELNEIHYIDMKSGFDDEQLARLIGSINKMLEQPKKRRALWTPATPLPAMPAPEGMDALQRADIETPTLELNRPVTLPTGDRAVARATIIAAIITGILGILGVVIGVILPALMNTPNAPTPTIAVTQHTTTDIANEPTLIATQRPSTLTPTPTPTDTPTITPTSTHTPSITPTLSPEQIALTPQTANAVWTPFERDFDSVTMVLVPAGCFMMGSNDGEDREQPVHQQCFDQPFWIDKFEVTNDQYGSSGRWFGNNLPRESVNWSEAQDFCEARDARLPTEAEWEYAARGPDGLIYPWGNEFIADNLVYIGNANNQIARVDSRPGGASWVGALDMSGNVWEWTLSEYRDYPYDPADDLESINANSPTTVRGGAWSSFDGLLPTTFRRSYFSSSTIYDLGFRCMSPVD